MRLVTVFALSLALLMSGPLLAENNDSEHNASFGIAVNGGVYNVWEKKKDKYIYSNYDFGLGFGGGFVLEKMFTNLLGIQSGIWIEQFNIVSMISNRFSYTDLNAKCTIKTWTLSIPLSLMLSFNKSVFSFNFLAGLKFSQAVSSKSTIKGYELVFPSTNSNPDVLYTLQNPQAAVTAGILFRFRTTAFTDFFFGGTGEFYFTEIEKNSSGSAHLFNCKGITGFMFRTNIFPMN